MCVQYVRQRHECVRYSGEEKIVGKVRGNGEGYRIWSKYMIHWKNIAFKKTVNN